MDNKDVKKKAKEAAAKKISEDKPTKKEPAKEKRLIYVGPDMRNNLLILRHGSVVKNLPKKMKELNEKYHTEELGKLSMKFENLFVEVKEYEKTRTKIKKGISTKHKKIFEVIKEVG